ncbi:MAG TPA: hypothetical protein VFN11_00765 [Ktedonobacterales bacterium]|nr:hypothetical protein [Ktedonobacterales bacterium]
MTGPGGIGKTRLSLDVAHTLLDAFPDGVWQVRLSRIVDATLVIPSIATTLGLSEVGGVPIRAVVSAYLRERRLLLVLDNFEQVVAAAPELAELLSACPGVTVLVTSRAPMRLSGEYEFVLTGLALPDPSHLPPWDRLSQYAAVALFIQRVQAVQTDFAVTKATAPTVAEICARLDGLPLAIELAAARVKIFPPGTLLKRLTRALPELVGGPRDLEERQQTLHNTLAWSAALLTPEEQRLFRRLSVFAGGWTLESAEAVCAVPEGIEPLGISVVDGLYGLIVQSLLQQHEVEGEGRFIMLHVIREFALEQLEASGEAEALRQAHAQHVLTWGTDSPLPLYEMGDGPWLSRMEREHDNIRASLGWALEREDVALGLQLGVGFTAFWFSRGYDTEGRRWLEALLAMEASRRHTTRDDDTRSNEWYWAMWWASRYAHNQSDVRRTCELTSELLAAARAQDNNPILMAALEAAWLAEWMPPTGDLQYGDRQQGERLLDEALALARQLPMNDVSMIVLMNFTHGLAVYQHDLERAESMAEELLQTAVLRRHTVSETYISWILATIALLQDNPARAYKYGRRALQLASGHGLTVYVHAVMPIFATVAAKSGDYARAARLLGAEANLLERLGIPLSESEDHEVMRAAISEARTALGENTWQAAFAAGKALTLEQAIAYALGRLEQELPKDAPAEA